MTAATVAEAAMTAENFILIDLVFGIVIKTKVLD